jgi:hypothetical protein
MLREQAHYHDGKASFTQSALLSLMNVSVVLFGGRGEAGIIVVSFPHHVVGFCSCFPHYETEFNTISFAPLSTAY